MRNSGWDFQNSNSFVTLSFWVKSSVSKNFYGQLFCQDSPFLQRSFETGTLSANTWTKVEVSIPGYSTMNFDHNEGPGFIITWYLYAPTSMTSGNGPLNTWMSYNASKRVPADSDAWWTADNATFDITGVQLEVGNVVKDISNDQLTKHMEVTIHCNHLLGTLLTVYRVFVNIITIMILNKTLSVK